MGYIVIAYDVSDDRDRARLAKVLESALPRVQKSVFEGDVPSNVLRGLLPRAVGLLKPEDRLRVYHVCAACAARTEAFGAAPGGNAQKPPPVRVL